jgi:hypothetical protein
MGRLSTRVAAALAVVAAVMTACATSYQAAGEGSGDAGGDGDIADGPSADAGPGVDGGACDPMDPVGTGPTSVFVETSCGGALVSLARDPKHCGACFHDCVGASCVDGLCAPATIADPSASKIQMTHDLAFDGEFLYWIGSDLTPGTPSATVFRTSKFSGNTVPTYRHWPLRGLAIDDAQGYSWEPALSLTAFAKIDGAGARELLYVGDFAGGLHAGSPTYLYFARDEQISRVRKSGGAEEMVVLEPAVAYLAGDAKSLFWISAPAFVKGTDAGAQGAIGSASLDDAAAVKRAPVPSPSGLAIDPAYVYYFEGSSRELRRASRDALDQHVALARWTESKQVAQVIATDGVNVYAALADAYEGTDVTIVRVSKCGGTPAALARVQSKRALAVDDTFVDWVTKDGKVQRVAK